jgi:serine/threonine-protein kinase HipA
MTTATVIMWSSEIGYVTWLPDRSLGVFQYNEDFVRSGIQVAPLMMPLSEIPFEFPALNRETFRGLPGMLADSLPDKFGNAVINAWLAREGRPEESFTPVERLCYTGQRGMGALEFEPVIVGPRTEQKRIEVDRLVELANQVLDTQADLGGVLEDEHALDDILRVGTSAGGARAKAILAWNPDTNEFRSGQIKNESGFEYWLLKFDGISNNRDKELADPQGFGLIEYTYHKMALQAGIEMTKCRIHEENGRHHFMTQRFDRDQKGGKVHMQTLGAIAHYDFNQLASYSYEQALQVMKRLGLSRLELEQQVLRTMFNVVARNHDDHVKNIAFLMDREGKWRLSPAYDVIYAYNPTGNWTSRHQMSVNGKWEHISREDLLQLASVAGIKRPRAGTMLDRVLEAVRQWPDIAEEVGVINDQIQQIQKTHRVKI